MTNILKNIETNFEQDLMNSSPAEVSRWELLAVHQMQNLPDQGNEEVILINARPHFHDENTDMHDVKCPDSQDLNKILQTREWANEDFLVTVETPFDLNDSIMIPITFLK